MPFICKICGINEVDNQGDTCELCAIGQDPYTQSLTPFGEHSTEVQCYGDSAPSNAIHYIPKRGTSRKVLLNGGTVMANQDPWGNDMSVSDSQSSVQVYSAGQVPQISKQDDTNVVPTKVSTFEQPITAGITKNIFVDNQKKSILSRWFRALFKGIPFALDNDVTMFQVFPDYSGTSLNALGNVCDQVIVYGKLNSGAVSENNDVEIYGRRDVNNNIIAKTIKNKASGTTITAERTIDQGVVWLITTMIVLLIGLCVMKLGTEGIIWSVVIVLCLTNIPKVFKIIGALVGIFFSILKKIF